MVYQTQFSRNHVEHSLSWFRFVLCHVTLIHLAPSTEQSCSHYNADPGIQGVVPHVISFYITWGLGIRNHRMESPLCYVKVVSRVAPSLDVLACLFMHGWRFLVSSLCFMLCFSCWGAPRMYQTCCWWHRPMLYDGCRGEMMMHLWCCLACVCSKKALWEHPEGEKHCVQEGLLKKKEKKKKMEFVIRHLSREGQW